VSSMTHRGGSGGGLGGESTLKRSAARAPSRNARPAASGCEARNSSALPTTAKPLKRAPLRRRTRRNPKVQGDHRRPGTRATSSAVTGFWNIASGLLTRWTRWFGTGSSTTREPGCDPVSEDRKRLAEKALGATAASTRARGEASLRCLSATGSKKERRADSSPFGIFSSRAPAHSVLPIGSRRQPATSADAKEAHPASTRRWARGERRRGAPRHAVPAATPE